MKNLTRNIQTQKDWEDYLVYRRQELGKLFDLPNSKLESLILDNESHKLTFCSARRVGKTYKILARMLFDLLHLPWFNGACLRKYQEQVESNLLGNMMKIGWDFVQSKIITELEFRKIKKTRTNITYDTRAIEFRSIENPNNSLGYQPSGGKFGHQALCQTLFIDELVQANDTYTLNVSKTQSNLNTIMSSYNRGIKAPFGCSFQVIAAYNPWDFNNVFYRLNVEKLIPVGQDYLSDEMVEKVEHNHKELLVGSGELVHKTKTGEVVYRGSYKIIPKERLNDSILADIEDSKVNNPDYFVCVYGGIHANIHGAIYTYLDNMPRKPMRYDKEIHGEKTYVVCGFDRGEIDNTVFSLVSIATTETGHKTLVLEDIKVFVGGKKKKETSPYNILNSLDFLIGWFERFPTLRQKLVINVDGAAREFNNLMFDWFRHNPELGGRYIVQNAIKDKHWGLKERQDFFNKLFSFNQFVFGEEMWHEKIEQVWIDFRECTNNDRGERNEKPNVNRLDIINSIEYAISHMDKTSFNIQ